MGTPWDQSGISPLDANLSLPRRFYSDNLRDWVGHEVVDAAFDKGARTIERVLGIQHSKRALETLVGDASEVDAFYDQKAAPAPGDEGPLLVVQADGSGVRLVGTEPSERTGHRTSKRKAVVTTIYSIDRHLSHRVAQRDGDHVQDRVALTDGAEALRARMIASLPTFTLVLDIIHVLDYLWATAQAAHGGWKSSACHGYVRTQLEALLSGETQAVIDELTRKATTLADYRRGPVDAAVRYFTRNAPYMRYDHYLARGWPIATGVIEGGCKHLVRGRMERSGMKWSRPGAEAMLKLRSTRVNSDWDSYQCLSRQTPPRPCPRLLECSG